MAQYLSALGPLAPHLKALTLYALPWCSFDAPAAAALVATLPQLQRLELQAFSRVVLPASALLQLVMGLHELQRLVLEVLVSGPADVALAAVTAQQQVAAGRRTEQLAILLSEWTVDAVAAAAKQLLEQGAWDLTHVKVV